jgi:hypothetical protein
VIRTPSSRKVIPLIASLLILHGLFGAAVLRKLGLVPTGLGFALTETVLGISLMMGYRWARWLTLGACFLAIVAALAVPILLFLVFGEPESQAIEFWRNVTSAMAIVFGVIGWFGLAYLRSEGARRDFSGLDPELRLTPEPSWSVLPPAALCLLLLLGTFDGGRQIGLFIAANEPAPAPVPDTSAVTNARAVADERDEKSDPVPAPAPVHDGIMDIALTDMCADRYRIRVQYTNLGAAPRSGVQFEMKVQVDWSMVHLSRDFVLDVPETGVSVWTPEFDLSNAHIREGVYVNVVAKTYSRNVGQINWENDRLIRNLILRKDRTTCPDVSTRS